MIDRTHKARGDERRYSWWRCVWSANAIAWHARNRTPAAIKLGTAALSVWWGTTAGWFLVFADEPFGTSAPASLLACGLVTGLTVVVIHGWTWLTPPGLRPAMKSPGLAVCVLAAVPACTLDLPDSLLSAYRDAVYFDTFLNTPTGWPPLPEAVEALTRSCMWFYAAVVVWVVFGIAGTVALRTRFPLAESTDGRCVGCGYDLRGTLAARIDRCPECGRSTQLALPESVGRGSPK